MAKITFTDLAHSYKQNPKSREDYALHKMSHVWEDGEAYALLGPSGCGKSTLLNIISGILTPSEGQIFFDEQAVTHASTVDRNIAQVFQFPVVYDTMSVRDNLAFPLRNRGADAKYIEQRVAAVAKAINMEEYLDKKAEGLSADAKQKISLGRGMVREDVNAILLDEPLTVIDPQVKMKLRAELKALHKELGHTMIFVTHDQTEALTFADKVVLMNEGDVIQIGSPEELFEAPAHTFVGYFIGSPGMNFFDIELSGSSAKINDDVIDLNYTYEKLSGHVQLGIRPEYINLCEKGEGLEISIQRIEDVGLHKLVRVQYQNQDINITVPEDVKITKTMTNMSFDKEHTLIYHDSWLVKGGKL